MSEMKNTLYEIIRDATLQAEKGKCQIISLICRNLKKTHTHKINEQVGQNTHRIQRTF